MKYKVITFGTFGEPTETEVTTKSFQGASLRGYCLLVDANGKYKRMFNHKIVGKKLDINKIWRDGKTMFLLTVDKRWQEVHEDDRYTKQEKVKQEKPKKVQWTNVTHDIVTPKTQTGKRIKNNVTLNGKPYKPQKKDLATLTYAEYVKKLEQQKATTAYLEETKGIKNSTPKKTSNESATGVTWRDLGIHGNTEKTSGDDSVKDTEGNTCSTGLRLSRLEQRQDTTLLSINEFPF